MVPVRSTQISPMLAVNDALAAISFYKAAFGALERWRIEGGGTVVAGLSIGDAELFLASANPPSTRGPDEVGGTTIRIELFVDDPRAAYEQAIAAGADREMPRSSTSTPSSTGEHCGCCREA